MKYLILLLTFLCLVSCKSPQKIISNSKLSKETNANNDISLNDVTRMSELTDQIIKKLIDERLNIDIKQIKYDTDKPIIEKTGKHPVVEEIEFGFNKETKVYETDSISQKTEYTSNIEFHDNSEQDTKIKIETSEEKETGLKKWQKILISIGGLTIGGLVIFLITKIMKIVKKGR